MTNGGNMDEGIDVPGVPGRVRSVEEFQRLVESTGTSQSLLHLLESHIDLSEAHFTGSLINGFGNLGSDIDVFVISDRESSPPRHWYWAEGRRHIDLVSVSLPDLMSTLQSLEQGDLYDPHWKPKNYFPYPVLDRLHRFRIAVALIEPDKLASLKGSADHALPTYLAVANYRDACAHWQDMAGAAASADMPQALICAELIAKKLLAAIAALGGETATHEKWLAKNVARMRGPGRDVARPLDQLRRRLAHGDTEQFSAVEEELEHGMFAVSQFLCRAAVGTARILPFNPLSRVHLTPSNEERRIVFPDSLGA